MLDALLHAVVDALRSTLGYDQRTCRDMPHGHPPSECGALFLAVHQGASSSTADNSLDERFGFSLTLTMRVSVPLDRVGDRLLAKTLAETTGFNARADAIRALLHMDWPVISAANAYILQRVTTGTVYGFCEPARYRGMEVPALVGGEWFFSAPEAEDVGLKAEMRFEDCRRLQAIGAFA